MSSSPLGAYKRRVPNRMSLERFKDQTQVELLIDTLDVPANPEPWCICFPDAEVGARIRSSSFVTQLFLQGNYVYEGRGLLWRWLKWHIQCIKQGTEIALKSKAPTPDPNPCQLLPLPNTYTHIRGLPEKELSSQRPRFAGWVDGGGQGW